MNDTGRLLWLLQTSKREDDWRKADEWRRLLARPDALPDALPVPQVEPRPKHSLGGLRRLFPGHT